MTTRPRDHVATHGLPMAAELVGVDGRTSRRWVNAERNIPLPATRYLRVVEADPGEVVVTLVRIKEIRCHVTTWKDDNAMTRR